MGAKPMPAQLSSAQQWALDWFKENGPVERAAYRNARITTGTVNSLIKAGLVVRTSSVEPRWSITYGAALKGASPSEGDADSAR